MAWECSFTFEAGCVYHARYQVWHILPGVVLVEVEDVHDCKQQLERFSIVQDRTWVATLFDACGEIADKACRCAMTNSAYGMQEKACRSCTFHI